jgi:hypothetical protein
MSGLPPKHGLLHVTVSSGPSPKHGNPALLMAAGQNPGPRARDGEPDLQAFTRAEIVSIRLADRKPRPFSVLLWIDTPGAILIESVEVSICEEDEPVFNIPVSTSSVELKRARDSQVFRLTDQQLAAISEHLEQGNTVKVRVRYLAADRSELKISIIEKEPHHKLRGVVATVALGFAVVSTIKYLLHSD